MIYLLKANPGKKRTRLIVFFIFLILFVSLLWFTPLISYLERTISFLTRPIFKTNIAIQENLPSITLKSKTELLKENEELQRKLDEARASLLLLDNLRASETILKEEFLRKGETRLLLAVILSKPNRSLYDTALIDVGERDQVSVGQLVFAYEHIPIGRVVEVYGKTSLMRLFSSPGEKSEVEIGEKNIAGVAEGVGGGNFRMLLPKDIEISVGNLIRLPALDSNAIGEVEYVERSENETFARIYFKSPVNIYELSRVFVELKD